MTINKTIMAFYVKCLFSPTLLVQSHNANNNKPLTYTNCNTITLFTTMQH